MSSLKEFIQHHEKIQNQELSKLQTHFLQPDTISPLNSVPHHINAETGLQNHQNHADFEEGYSSSSFSESSSSSNSETGNLTNILKKTLRMKTKKKSKEAKPISKRSYEKKALSLASKKIKNAA